MAHLLRREPGNTDVGKTAIILLSMADERKGIQSQQCDWGESQDSGLCRYNKRGMTSKGGLSGQGHNSKTVAADPADFLPAPMGTYG